MFTHHHDGAAAPGPAAPKSDNAPWQARVGGDEGVSDGRIIGPVVASRYDGALADRSAAG